MEEIVIRVAAGKIRIKDGRCPKGCDLMDPTVPLSGAPSIKVEASLAGKRASMHLNAFYGVYEYRTALPLEPGNVVELYCPSCGVSLADRASECSVCKIPMAVVHLGDGGQVAACPKIGCHNHRLVIVDMDAQLGRLYEDTERKMVM